MDSKTLKKNDQEVARKIPARYFLPSQSVEDDQPEGVFTNLMDFSSKDCQRTKFHLGTHMGGIMKKYMGRGRGIVGMAIDAEAGTITLYHEPRNTREDVSHKLISEFKLSTRTRNCLSDADCETISDVLVMGRKRFSTRRNVGEVSVGELDRLMKSLGIFTVWTLE